jgi:LysR family pca operon transcriptional activator
LRRGEFDFVVAHGGPPNPERGLRESPVTRNDCLKFVVRCSHPLASKRQISLAELCNFPWLFPIVGTLHSPLLKELFSGSGVDPPHPRIESGSMQFARTVILEIDAIGLLAEHAMEPELRAGLMTVLPYDHRAMHRSISIFHRERHPLSSAARTVMVQIEQTCRNWRPHAGTRRT